MRWSLLLLFLCCSCQSKPVATANSSSKATPTPEAPPRELYVRVEKSPRAIESQVATNGPLQQCWIVAPDLQFLVLEGWIDRVGRIAKITVQGEDKALRECVKAALGALSLGKGPKGPVKLQLSTDPARIPGAKGLILQPPPVKKFQ